MVAIKNVKAMEVYDSRGIPTVEAVVTTSQGAFSAIVPSGTSSGKYEAVELRDGGKRLSGKGVTKAVDNINRVIAKKITGMDPVLQKKIDAIMIELDGTKNKGKLGANAILAVSMAVCRAGAAASGQNLYEYVGQKSAKDPILPVPMMNVINGGVHGVSNLNIQEFLILPTGASSFREAMEFCVDIYQQLKLMIKKSFGTAAVSVGYEGGFAPPLDSSEKAVKLVAQAIEEVGLEKKIKIGLDAAASEFFNIDLYSFEKKALRTDQLYDFYTNLIEKYDIISLEDPFSEDDWEGFKLIKKNSVGVQIVGDDLLVTSVERIKKAIELNACNALLLKLNQIGTVSEALDAAKLSFDNKWNVVVSHRSGDSEDSFIADFVVGLGAGQSKFGAPARSDRVAKYNQLLRIEEQLGSKAKYFRWKI